MIHKEELEKLIYEGKNVEECCDILKISRRKLLKLRKDYKLNRNYFVFVTNCQFCKKQHNYKALEEKSIYFCSLKCSLSVRKHTEETKKKISNTLKSRIMRTQKHCGNCGKDITHKRNKKFCSRSCSSSYNTPLIRDILSKKRIQYLENSNIEWFDTHNIEGKLIKVQGKWEKEFASSCNKLGIVYDRCSVRITENNNYTPDFYLKDLDIYVEVKGYLYEKDKYKMLKAIDYSCIDLRIIFDINKIKGLNYKDLELLEKVKDIISYDKIDYTKFVKRY